MNNNELYDSNASLYVLSCLMRKPLIIEDDEYAIIKTDFCQPLQQIIYTSIFNMAKQGISEITPQDLDIYLKQFPTMYAFYESNRGLEWAINTYTLSEKFDKNQFNYYYQRLKKFSMLRDLQNAGYNISEFYDTNADFLNRDKEDEKLNKTQLQEIPNKIREIIAEIENKHIGKDNGNSQNAAEGMRKLVEKFKQVPEVGLPLDGDIYNYATRGARKGKLYIYSAPSGMGKTRSMMGNACAISMPYIEIETNKIIMRDVFKKVLFVATEMDAEEIQTLLLAYVSGVNEKNILLGNYTPEEEKRIEMALDIIDKYKDNFIIEAIPDPSIATVKARLVKYILQNNIEYIFYDYIFSSPGLLSEFRDINVREDVALMMLSNTLKEVAMQYKVFIQSGTQLNDNWSKTETGLRDQNCIRGSKAIVDKVDVGVIAVRINDKEKQCISQIYNELKRHTICDKNYDKEPNMVLDIYKNRRGEMNCVKIFRYFDFSTCRSADIFVTDSSYRAVENVGKLIYNKRPFDYLELKTGGQL